MAKKLYTITPNRWVETHSDYLFNFAMGKVNDRDIAKDLISETFLAALKAKDNFKGEASERTWLVAILKRKIIDYYRKINSNKGKAEVKVNYFSTENDGDWLEERIENPDYLNIEDNIINDELSEAIYACLDKINPRQATIFKLKTIENYDTEVICNEYNITSSNLWVIIHRVRAALADCLKEKWLS